MNMPKERANMRRGKERARVRTKIEIDQPV